MRRPTLFLVSVSLIALTAAGTWLARGAASPTVDRSSAPSDQGTWESAGLATAPDRATRGFGQAPAWGDASLIAALTELGQVADLLDPRLQELSRPILGVPERVARSLELLRGPELYLEPGGVCAPERGAVLALGLAAATYGRAEGHLPAGVRDLDRQVFVTGLIEALPDLRPPVAGRLVSLVERLRLGGRPVVGAGFFQVVLELRRAHPELRDLLDHLLEECAAELPGEERRAIASLFVNETEDATLVKVAFAQLLAGEGGRLYLDLARARLDDAATPKAVRSAILEAVASAAPTDSALEVLAPHLDVESVNALFLLAQREGGAEALIAAYDGRLTNGHAPEERRWLVAGLEGAGEQELLFDIARTDPDRSVRGQAMLSVSLDTGRPTPALLEAVLAGRDQPGDPFVGLDAQHSSMALANLALGAGRAGDLELERQALDEARGMVLSKEFSPHDRQFALNVLRHQLPAHELAELQARLTASLEQER